MCTDDSGSTKFKWTGNPTGDLNSTGDYNSCAGGPEGSNLSSGTAVGVFTANPLSRRPWLAQNAAFNDLLLDACYPTINLQWFLEISLNPTTTFRVSDRAFYVQDADGAPRFYDARVDKIPVVNVTIGEWLNSNYEISDLVFSLNNRDGYFNDYLPHGDEFRQWSGGTVVLKVGFGEVYTNYFTLFEGQITTKDGMGTTRDTVELRAYDKFDRDEIPLPINSYTSDIFPDIEETEAGKAVPIVYGDWTEDVPTWGSVPAVCTNSDEDDAEEFEFKISDFSLESIDSVWLHRGKFKEGEPLGPIQFDIDALTLNLADGKFTVAPGDDVFLSESVLYSDQQCGSGSTTNLVAAKDASINFQNQKIQIGDRVLKSSTGEIATVSSITSSQLTCTGGVVFAQDDDYIILTKKYKFLKGDKVSVTCKGKLLNVLSTTRLTDASTSILSPNGVALGTDNTLWFCDDATQKVYNITFRGVVVQEITYASIDASISSLSSITIGSDNYLWVADPDASKLYRYNYVDLGVGKIVDTLYVTGIAASLGYISGVVVKSDNNLWIVDKDTSTFYEIDVFSNPIAEVVTTFDETDFDAAALEVMSIGYDNVNSQVLCADRTTNKFYRLDDSDGSLDASTLLSTAIDEDVAYVTGVCVAQDGTLLFLDRGTLSVYNYSDASYTNYNPCFIARDMLQKMGGHTYDEFDLSWNETASQLSGYKARAVVKDKTTMITYVNNLLKQFNVMMFSKFNKYALFWMTFANFTVDNKDVKEIDIKEGSFKPSKEISQYFNSAVADYDRREFQGKSLQSDTYVSAAGIAFAGQEVNKKLSLPNVYRRTDIDRIIPLFVRLAVPEPEFIEVTLGFRLIRAQMQSFVNFTFDDSVDCDGSTSGRRFTNVPCMIRKISYDLNAMTVKMRLWSLGGTEFPGYTPSGAFVGGYADKITLTTVGRLGRISPIGTITDSDTNSVDVSEVDSQDAETRTHVSAGLAWQAGYKVALINGETKAVVQTLTIASVSGDTITFVEDFDDSVDNTSTNSAGFITGGHYIQQADYDNLSAEQKDVFASFSPPTSAYPTSRAKELEQQRGGEHSFTSDDGLPYVLYPQDFTPVP